jgi:hypothetical protein
MSDFTEDVGGGEAVEILVLDNLGTCVADAATVIAHNHASTSNDDCFGW